MLQNNNTDYSFNNFISVPKIPYQVFEYLLQNTSQESENFWKLLKYSDIDCLNRDNLTYEEKHSLIWAGQTDEHNYSLFPKPLVTNSMDEAKEMIMVRMFRKGTVPNDRLEAVIIFEIDIFTNDKTACVFYDGVLVERTDLIEALLLSLLNGVDIGIGYDYFRFDREISRSSQSAIGLSNSKSFYGRELIFALKYSNTDIGGECY